MRTGYRAGQLAAGLLLSSATVLAHAANLSPGPYVEAFAGYSDIAVELDGQQRASGRIDADGGAYGASLGYLAPWGPAAIGVAVNAAAEDASATRDIVLQDPDGGASEAGQLRIQGDYGYGVKLMLGGFIARKVLVYGFGGWQWFRGEAEVTRADGSFVRESEDFEGPRAGVGAAIPLHGNALSLRVEASRTFYDTENAIEPTQDRYTVGIAYSF